MPFGTTLAFWMWPGHLRQISLSRLLHRSRCCVQIANAFHDFAHHIVHARVDFGRVGIDVVTCILSINKHVLRCGCTSGKDAGQILVISGTMFGSDNELLQSGKPNHLCI